MPLSDGRISGGLVEVTARFNNALSQLVDISNVKILFVHGVLHYTPYLTVRWVKVRTVGGPYEVSEMKSGVSFASRSIVSLALCKYVNMTSQLRHQ